MANHYQVTTTASTKDDASRLAHMAVGQRLAACAQVSGPITSVYRWEGRVETDDEWICVFKTSARALRTLEEAIRAAHGYTTPEIVATPIEGGDADYLAWIDAGTSAPSL